MSIDDDFYDMQAFIETSKDQMPEWARDGMDDTWDRLGKYMSTLETDNEALRKRVGELELTVRTMMGLVKPRRTGTPSPYDASINRRK